MLWRMGDGATDLVVSMRLKVSKLHLIYTDTVLLLHWTIPANGLQTAISHDFYFMTKTLTKKIVMQNKIDSV